MQAYLRSFRSSIDTRLMGAMLVAMMALVATPFVMHARDPDPPAVEALDDARDVKGRCEPSEGTPVEATAEERCS